MNQLKKVTYATPSYRELWLEPRESIAQSSPSLVILASEIDGEVKPAAIDIESLGYEVL